jgi:Sigma-54 interaction domain
MEGSARRAVNDAPMLEATARSEEITPVSFSDSEWRILRATRPNILVVGAEDDVRSTVDALVAEFPGPVSYLGPNAPPPSLDEAGMLVVPDVAALSSERQREWLTWLSGEDVRRPQIVATSSVPVYPLVEEDRFSEVLYYRLNTILLDMQASRGAYRRYSEF